MTQYILEIPKVDSSLPWHRVKVFNRKVEIKIKLSDHLTFMQKAITEKLQFA